MKLCASTDFPAVHWHDSGLHLIPELLKIKNLKMIQISHDPNGPDFEMMLEICKSIVENGVKVCFQTEYDLDKVKKILKVLPYNSFMLYLPYIENISEVGRTLNEIETIIRR
jgi:hypothetical protein